MLKGWWVDIKAGAGAERIVNVFARLFPGSLETGSPS